MNSSFPDLSDEADSRFRPFDDKTLDKELAATSGLEILDDEDHRPHTSRPQGAWKVLTANTGLHLLLLLLLAYIVVPRREDPDRISITSKMSAEGTLEPLLQQVVLEQPSVAELPSTKVETDLVLENGDEFVIDENNFAPSVQSVTQKATTPAAVAPVKRAVAGRSQAGKSELLVRYGGTEESEAAVGGRTVLAGSTSIARRKLVLRSSLQELRSDVRAVWNLGSRACRCDIHGIDRVYGRG